RVPPGLDDKMLTAWNGLMIASLAKGARVLDEPKYAAAAARAAEFVLTHLRKDGRLLRTWRKGEARLTGYLNDYAFFIEGLLNLYEATFDMRWLREAEALADTCHAAYFNSDKGGFFLTANDGEKLIARSQNAIEGAIPSGNAVHALNLLRLAVYFDRKDLRDQAESIFKAYGQSMERIPQAFERMLCALDFYYGKPKEIALVPGSGGDLNSLVRTVYAHYLPNKVLAAATDAQSASAMPLLKGKTTIDGRPTAYVCQNYTCKRPVQTSEELKALLWSVGKKE
ncbi:MAG: thioredoxin domain-containing protein, partial [Planctomycetes bacterium]|nr:thioredoxin domain-containing protein [Planctomycetota bacterium]